MHRFRVNRIQRKAGILLCISFLLSSGGFTPVIAAEPTLTTCISLKTGLHFVSKSATCLTRHYETRIWNMAGNPSQGKSLGSKVISINLCTNKSTGEKVIRKRCNPRTQSTTVWQRTVTAPDAPQISTVTMDELGSASITIQPSRNDGGARITSYTVIAFPGPVTATIAAEKIASARITGLTPGVKYRFSVTANNLHGSSSRSDESRPLFSPTIPSAPIISAITLAGANTARISFSAPIIDGDDAGRTYIAELSTGNVSLSAREISPGLLEVSNLPYSTKLSITLIIKNIAGSSAPSSPSEAITTLSPPLTPEPTPTNSASPVAAPAFTLSASSETRTANTVATGFTVLSTGGAIASFAISPAAPAGMSFNTSTGAFTGTPTTVAATTSYTVTGTNATDSATAVFSFTVSLPAPAFTLSASSETRTANTVATGFTVLSTGGAVASYAISPAAPAGMSFNTSTGAFSGTPTSVAAATEYTITGTNATGSSSAVFTLTVAIAAPAFTLSSSSETRNVNRLATGFTITSTGGTVASYAISPIAPAGMSFNTSTGAFSGTPTSSASATEYTVTATNASGTSTAVFTFTVSPGCSAGGVCEIGDTGPGGGKVFYISPTPNAGSTPWRYLETAPSNWKGATALSDVFYWCSDSSSTSVATAENIGSGSANTQAIIQGCANASTPADMAIAYRGGGLSDWFLPSRAELGEMYLQENVIGGYAQEYYWSSSQGGLSSAWARNFDNGGELNGNKNSQAHVRPIRAIS